MAGYRLQGELERQSGIEGPLSRKYSRFILATNQLDSEEWPGEKLLREYKQQQQVERGFRFLKDPLFFTSSVFVKKPQRIEALALLMALTLLVYTIAERKLRRNLAILQETVLDQRKRPSPHFDGFCRSFRVSTWYC